MTQSGNQNSLYMQAERQLLQYLNEVPFIRGAKNIAGKVACDTDSDLLFALDLQGQPQYLSIVMKKNGQPRSATEAIYRLRSSQNGTMRSYPVFMAPYISPRVAQLCQQKGVGYADFAGNCFLSFDKVYLKREHFPNPMVERREQRSLFTNKATAIYRVLLRDPRETYSLSTLSKVANVSIGQSHNVIAMLIAREWMLRVSGGVKLTEPEQLLRSWAQQYSTLVPIRYDYYTDQPLGAIEHSIAQCSLDGGPRGVLTGFAGAERLAPYTRYQRVHAWVIPDVETLAASLNLKAVSSGANVTLYRAPDESVFFDLRQLEETYIASPIQIYLDLIHSGGRGEDAAQHLFETVIKSSW